MIVGLAEVGRRHCNEPEYLLRQGLGWRYEERNLDSDRQRWEASGDSGGSGHRDLPEQTIAT